MKDFTVRNAIHTHLLKQLVGDAEKNGYHFQLLGNETLDMPIQAQYNDKTSWMIRATPDGLALKDKAFLLEGKTKMNDRQNISMELIPLEIYQEKAEDIYVVAETKLKGGLDTCKVVHAKDIEINWIDIPNRRENFDRITQIQERYPYAYVRTDVTTDGGSGTPYVIIQPKIFNTWMSWYDFRDAIMLHKKDNWFLSHKMGRQLTLNIE